MMTKVSFRSRLVLSFLFALATVTGYCLDHVIPSGPMAGGDFFIFVLCILTAAISYCLFSGLYCGLECFAATQEETRFSVRKKLLTWLFAFLIIFLCWIPVWLAYYPGLWNYDPWQVWQYVKGEYDRFHPLIHTLLLGACYASGEPNQGVVLYDLIQMSIMAGIFAYAYVYIAERIRSGLFRFLVLLFFAIFPVNSILAISSTKDVIFSGLVLLCWVMSARFLEGGPEHRGARWAFLLGLLLCAVLMLLFRNNGIHAFYLFAAFAVLMVLRGKLEKKVLLFLLCCLVVFHAADRGLTRFLSAKPALFQEMLSIPNQQIGRIYTLTKDEDAARLLRSFYKQRVRYNPHKADPMKGGMRPLSEDEVLQFLKGSWALCRKYPFITLVSWLYLTEGSWYINDTSHASMYGTGLKGRQGYLLTDVKKNFKIVHKSKLPALESWLERAFSANEYQNWPLVPIFFAPALYLWILLFCSVGFYCTRQWNGLFLSGFLWALFLTILAGPCALIRYSYPLVVCAPVLFCMLVRALRWPATAQSPADETQTPAAPCA